MGLYVKGAFGAFSGKVGNLIGSNWRSIDYLRSRPRPSRKPGTEKQIAQRNKFAMAVDFLSPLTDLLNVGFNDKAKSNMTGFNRATFLLLNMIEGENPNFTIPYDRVIFSKGKLATVNATINTDIDSLSIRWPLSGRRANSQGDDVVNLILYNMNTNDFFVIQDTTRAEGSIEITNAELGSGEFHAWSFASATETGQRSNTLYLGAFEI